MKRKLLIVLVIILSLGLVFAGCGKKKKKVDEKAMYTLGSALTKLASAVESTVRYKKPPKGISDAELLTLSTKHDPKLLAPFAEYKVRISQKNRHALILVCSKDGKQGLLEDAGCSKEMDVHLWKSGAPCKFILDLDKVCKK